MSRKLSKSTQPSCNVPRASGDEPTEAANARLGAACSPRERG